MAKRRMIACLLLVMLAMSLPIAQADEPGVNQAIVVLNGETIVMQAVSMEVGKSTLVSWSTSGSGLYGSAFVTERTPTTEYCPVEILRFVQVDPRSGVVVKEMELILPSNWEKGKRYSTADAMDKLYGKVAMKLLNNQTGRAHSIYAQNTPRAEYASGGSMQLIIDDANADYSMVKGRFVAEISLYKTDPNPLIFELSSFYLDKSLLNQTAAESQENVFPPLADLP